MRAVKCFWYGTRVLTEDGWLRIGEIVNGRKARGKTMKQSEILRHNATMAAVAEELLDEDGMFEYRHRRVQDAQYSAWLRSIKEHVMLPSLVYEVRSIRDGVAEYLDGKWIDLREYPADQRREVVCALAEVVPDGKALSATWVWCEADAAETFPCFPGGMSSWGRDRVEDMRRHGPLTPNEILKLAGKDPIEPRKPDPHAELNPEVVCLCGSTKFKDEYESEMRRLTLEGKIVLSVGLFGHKEGLDMDGETKRMLDLLHKQKIRKSDRVHIINPGNYIGDSTRSEILFAEEHNILITYLQAVNQTPDPIEPRKPDPHAEGKAYAAELMERDGGYLWRSKIAGSSHYPWRSKSTEECQPQWLQAADYDIQPLPKPEPTPRDRLVRLLNSNLFNLPFDLHNTSADEIVDLLLEVIRSESAKEEKTEGQET